jgi:hypothetical protein
MRATHIRHPSPIEADIGSPTVDAAVLQIGERSSPATFGVGDSLRSGKGERHQHSGTSLAAGLSGPIQAGINATSTR